MKKELENATPEPREPAAREQLEAKAMEFIIERGWEDNNYGVTCVVAEFALAYSAELRAERDKALKAVAQWARIGHPILDALENHKPLGSMGIEPEPYVTRIEELLASERSLLQARAELIPAVQLLLEWMPKYSIGSSGYLRQERVMKALLASTSAPEGGASK